MQYDFSAFRTVSSLRLGVVAHRSLVRRSVPTLENVGRDGLPGRPLIDQIRFMGHFLSRPA